MPNLLNYIFLLGIMMTTGLAYSSDSWFQLWISLEMNMMMFMPLLFDKTNLAINSMMKYFIVQAFASSIFIFSMLISLSLQLNMMMFSLISMAMLTKLGMFPFYNWFPQISEGLSWKSFFLLSTWQKLIPLYILSPSNKLILTLSIMMSAMIGCVGMMNQISLRKVMAYSSITHMSWMALSMLNSNNNWMMYMAIYMLIMLSLYLIFKKYNSSTVEEFKLIFNKNMKLIMIMSFMSLGGLPPLLGFFPKWMILMNTTYFNMLLMFVLIFSSLISIYIYLRLTFPIFFFNNSSFYKLKMLNPFNFTSFMNLFLLTPIIPLIIF